MIGKTSKVYEEIKGATKELLEGVMVSCDPSIGSTSSQPGWAVYRAGELLASGTFEIAAHKSIPERLHKLHSSMRKLYNEYDPDVLVYEQIPAQRYGGGNAWSHASLLKALGVILSIPGPDKYVGILPVSWKKMVRDTYVKGDREDAEEIGWIAIQVAREIANG